ncbi:hypothetical protein I7I51_01484 [Histoplasma capsulatum]|uniref:Uncharacterized protein n=1 Tax=Ajellomyces capsulatus TaxID=5037 RepID=A0A8A1MJY9_AJECA|nr:hypothetical protein I7I51_01484 [Histoplasma capsulatum]
MSRAGAGTTSVPPPHEHRASTRSHGTLRQSGPVRGLAWAVLTHPIRTVGCMGKYLQKLKNVNQKKEIESSDVLSPSCLGTRECSAGCGPGPDLLFSKLPTVVGHLHLLGVKVRRRRKKTFR